MKRKFHGILLQELWASRIWLGEKIVYPSYLRTEPPNDDLPDDVKSDYEEARRMAELSSRAAAALLRLAIHKLCAYLGEPGKDIDENVEALAAVGLPPEVMEILEQGRVIGDQSVCPGLLDLGDDKETVEKLFKVLNLIAYKMITESKEIEELYYSPH